jgi:hypothetical protein
MLVGCTGGPADTVMKASSKMDKLSSFTTKMAIEVAGTSEEGDVEVSMVLDGKMDIKNKKNAFTINMDMAALSISMDMYTVEENGKITTYTENPFGVEEWVKTVEDAAKTEEDTTAMYKNATEMLTIIDKASEFKEVKSDLKDNKKYDLIIPNTSLKELLSNNDDYLGLEESDVSFNEEGNTTISVYITKDGYIGKMVIDMSQLIKSNTEEAKITKMLFTIEFSKFDQSTVTIPKEVIDSAVLDTEEE